MGWVGFDSVWSVHVMPRTSIFTRRSSSYQTGCFWQSMQVEHWPVLKKQSICSAMTCCAKTRNGQSRWVLQENFRSKGRGMVKKNRSLHCAILFFFTIPCRHQNLFGWTRLGYLSLGIRWGSDWRWSSGDERCSCYWELYSQPRAADRAG